VFNLKVGGGQKKKVGIGDLCREGRIKVRLGWGGVRRRGLFRSGSLTTLTAGETREKNPGQDQKGDEGSGAVVVLSTRGTCSKKKTLMGGGAATSRA